MQHLPLVCVIVTFVLVPFVAPMPAGWLSLDKVHKIMPSADKQSVLNCVLANRGVDKPDCWVVDKKSIESFRDAMAKHYYDMLTDSLKHIDGCLHMEAMMMTPMPAECSYLDDIDLVEHCFLHHQCQPYEPCLNISYPNIVLPNDTRTLFRYGTWLNVSTEHYAQNIPKNSSDLKTIVKQCALHCSTWLNDPNSVCHSVGLPKPDEQSSDQVRSMQQLYQELQVTDRKRDCQHYHQDELNNGTGECGKHYSQFEHANTSINLDVLQTPKPTPKPKPVTEPTVTRAPHTKRPRSPAPSVVPFLKKLLNYFFSC